MAATLSPVLAYEHVKKYLKSMPLEGISVRLLDDVNKLIWTAAPWRWTLASLPVVTVTANTTDFTIVEPADFLYLHDAFISDGAQAPRWLTIEPTLPPSSPLVGQPAQLARVAQHTLRIAPKYPTVGATAIYLISRYKKIAPTITATNQYTAGTLVMDDEWFPVYEAGVLWQAYLWGDDQRAGSVTVTNNGQIQYGGQGGVFQGMLAEMRRAEKLPMMTDVPQPLKERG